MYRKGFFFHAGSFFFSVGFYTSVLLLTTFCFQFRSFILFPFFLDNQLATYLPSAFFVSLYICLSFSVFVGLYLWLSLSLSLSLRNIKSWNRLKSWNLIDFFAFLDYVPLDDFSSPSGFNLFKSAISFFFMAKFVVKVFKRRHI